MAQETITEIRAAVLRELAETHGSAVYLADNLATVCSERDEFEADAERFREFAVWVVSKHGRNAAISDTLAEIVDRARQALSEGNRRHG